MELTRIHLNIGNPGVRRDVSDPYEMHSTLARAFAAGPTSPPERFLWRLEATRSDQTPVVLVQSEAGGHWEVFEHQNPGWMARRETRSWIPESALRPGLRVGFRIRCNPTVTRQGKRLGLWRESEQRAWFARQAAQCGLGDVRIDQVTGERLLGRRRKGEGPGVIVCAAQFDGFAVIDAPALVAGAVHAGIGHAKMMGLGLLSLAPAF